MVFQYHFIILKRHCQAFFHEILRIETLFYPQNKFSINAEESITGECLKIFAIFICEHYIIKVSHRLTHVVEQ